MAYVVAIDVDDGATDRNDGATHYRVFQHAEDAIALFDRASSADFTRTRSGEVVDVLGCRMYRVDVNDPRQAVQLVKDGKAERFFKPASPELDALLGDVPESETEK